MKIHIDLPWKGCLHIEWEPVEPYKLYTMCWCITICIVLVSFFKNF